MNSIDEFKTILALAGNRRLPHLEAEIFADDESTTLYLNNLCKEYGWRYTSDSYRAYYYAILIIGERWPEAEAVIKSHKDRWIWYCDDFGITDE